MAILTAELERKVNSTQLDTALLRAFDPGVPTFCESCQTGYSLISIHKKIFHSGSKEYKCAFCGMPFVNRKGLLDHLDAHSDGSDLFCCFCLSEQKSDDALSEHLETHKELHVFLCSKCRRTFASKLGLSGHDCVVSTDVKADATAELVPNVLMVCSDAHSDKIDEEIDIHLPKPRDESDASRVSEKPEGGLESDNMAKNNRQLVNIVQRHLILSESSVSESVTTPTSNCGTSVKQENVNDVQQLPLTPMTEKTVTNLEDIIEIKVGFDMHQERVTDLRKCPEQIAELDSAVVKREQEELVPHQCVSLEVVGGETDSVNLEFDMSQEPVDHSVSVDQIGEANYVKVEFSTHQETSTERCVSVAQNSENDVNVEFNTEQTTITDCCAGNRRESVDVAFGTHQELITGDRIIAQDSVGTSCVKLEFEVHHEREYIDTCTDVELNGSNGCVTVEFDTQSFVPLSLSYDAGGVVLPDTPPNSKDDHDGGSITLAQCPSTAIIADTTNPCSFDDELPQQAELPPNLTTEKQVTPEESHTDPKSAVDARPEEALVEIDTRTLRSTRKRCHAATIDRLDSENLTPSGVQTFIGEPTGRQLADSTEPTPPDSPAPMKKKKISFNEQIEYWNPILRERAWLDITEEFPEVREVPLLKASSNKSRKKDKKKSKKKKKAKSRHSKKIKTEFNEEETPESATPSPSRSVPGAVTSDGFGTPTKPTGPLILRPVLKPSPSPQVTTLASELTTKVRWGVDSRQLFKKFGTDFSYKKCLKVDGRFHCPDGECRNNNDRGFSTDKGLRHHIRQNHIQAITYDCGLCDKSFPAPSKLKHHMAVHNSPDSYSCPTCGKKFKTKLSLKVHVMRHERPFACYHCGLRFAQKESVRVHLRTTECPCCEEVLRCAELFRRHEVDVPHLYQCSACGKALRTLQTFNWHVRNVHYEESTALDGTWICHVCDRKFTSRNIAVKHARIKHRTCTRGTDQPKADR